MSFRLYNPLNSDWLLFPLVLAGIFAVITMAEILLKKFHWSADSSRRVVHMLVGILICATRFFFESKYPVILLSVIFILVNLFTLLSKKFKGMHATNRVSFGTVYYPVAILILTYFFWADSPLVYILSILILAIGDPAASIVGESATHAKTYRIWKDMKSIQGSLTLAGIIFLLTVAGLLLGNSAQLVSLLMSSVLIIAMAAALVGTAAESISYAGSDNLSLPLLTAALLDIMLNISEHYRITFFAWILVSLIVVIVSYRVKVLQLSGAVTAFLLGSFVFGTGGLSWMIPMGVFFGISSVLSKIGSNRKAILDSKYAKSGNRDMMQVLANAGLAFPLVLLWFYSGNQVFYLAYLAALASATADTWATELGALSKQQPRDILTLRPVSKGTSGGISWTGTFSALLGAAVLAISGWLITSLTLQEVITAHQMLLITAAGFAASLLDSILGASVQAQYRCNQCEAITEKTTHCGSENQDLCRGISWINNDVVNFLCTLFGAFLIFIFA